MRKVICPHGKEFHTGSTARFRCGCEELKRMVDGATMKFMAEFRVDRADARIFAMGVYKGMELAGELIEKDRTAAA